MVPKETKNPGSGTPKKDQGGKGLRWGRPISRGQKKKGVSLEKAPEDIGSNSKRKKNN